MSTSHQDSDAARRSARTGVLAGAAAFGLWGVFPVYWKLLSGIPAPEILAHRVAWTLLFLLIVVPTRGHFGQFVRALRTPREAGLYLLSGSLLACNWLTFIYSILSNQVLESSLGYFLTPLFNVTLGFIVLRERLRAVQWFAIGLAALGVLVQVVQLGKLPWIALVLAGSFSIYGLLRKQGPLGPLTGLAVETTGLFPIAVGYLVWLGTRGEGTVWGMSLGTNLILASTGVITALPLLLFATAARRLRLATVGLLQYLAPTGHFFLGVFLYGEPFSGARVLSFVLIWVGLVAYTADSLRHEWRRPPRSVPPLAVTGTG